MFQQTITSCHILSGLILFCFALDCPGHRPAPRALRPPPLLALPPRPALHPPCPVGPPPGSAPPALPPPCPALPCPALPCPALPCPAPPCKHKQSKLRDLHVPRAVQNWGLEITMFSLLLAAFLVTNILSLLYMGMIAVGMWVRPAPRRRAWRFFFVPALGLILLFQYSILIG